MHRWQTIALSMWMSLMLSLCGCAAASDAVIRRAASEMKKK